MNFDLTRITEKHNLYTIPGVTCENYTDASDVFSRRRMVDAKTLHSLGVIEAVAINRDKNVTLVLYNNNLNMFTPISVLSSMVQNPFSIRNVLDNSALEFVYIKGVENMKRTITRGDKAINFGRRLVIKFSIQKDDAIVVKLNFNEINRILNHILGMNNWINQITYTRANTSKNREYLCIIRIIPASIEIPTNSSKLNELNLEVFDESELTDKEDMSTWFVHEKTRLTNKEAIFNDKRRHESMISMAEMADKKLGIDNNHEPEDEPAVRLEASSMFAVYKNQPLPDKDMTNVDTANSELKERVSNVTAGILTHAQEMEEGTNTEEVVKMTEVKDSNKYETGVIKTVIEGTSQEVYDKLCTHFNIELNIKEEPKVHEDITVILSYRVAADGNPGVMDYNMYTAIKVITVGKFERVNKIVRTQNTILIEVKIPHDLPVGDVIKVSSATHMAVSLNSSVGISEIMGATPLLDAFNVYVENLSPILK